ncbi:FAD/NAD(P)-binding domain-containing protein [Coniochaeta ligniaria NRRL 30616]|uniref:NADPH:adrenodoxin oxidoreductase, mitochondrial n=1 Tax=Coniochaeta ligniaria NRRL 30616 TaxID=1408157 RepID=A0A1J7JLA4_9PEZI|nr:FAD/NAD(P)-binding domain-containing protein [Coniochaeta ligniaria NRRL 30616]
MPLRIIGPTKAASEHRELLTFTRNAARRYTTEAVSRNGRQFRMAVIGSGPAGFYTAYRVMSRVKGAKVDMYEQLPVPFGLVRFGVAPDHPEVKNCQEKFDEVASSPDFTFVGNASIGHPNTHRGGVTIPLPVLLRNYDAVVFAYGASRDKTLGIPGESLKGIYSAREFVGWYNGLPDFTDLAPDLTQGEDAVLIGQGNVALDVARMLLEDVDRLRKTDITEHALETLSKSRIKRVHIVGRRGPMQAAFTIKEIREMMKLPDVAFNSIDTSLIPDDVKKLPRAQKRLMEILLKGSPTSPDQASKSWFLDFCLSPKSFKGSATDPSRVGSTQFEKTQLSSPFDTHAFATGTGEMVDIPSSVVFRSIGYKSVPLDGFSDLGVPFDEKRGIIQNDGEGRVQQEARTHDGVMGVSHFPGLYCAGWVKRGPTGVIASTMIDAFATADAIAQDWAAKTPFLNEGTTEDRSASGWDAVKTQIDSRQARVVKWDEWQKIDSAEKERGQKVGKEREKFTRTADMLAVLS